MPLTTEQKQKISSDVYPLVNMGDLLPINNAVVTKLEAIAGPMNYVAALDFLIKKITSEEVKKG